MHSAGNMKLRAGKMFFFQGLAFLRVVIHTLYRVGKEGNLTIPQSNRPSFWKIRCIMKYLMKGESNDNSKNLIDQITVV